MTKINPDQNYFFNGDAAAEQIRANAVSFINRIDLTQRWKVTVKAAVKSRSQKQLNALWGVAYPAIADHDLRVIEHHAEDLPF